MGARPQGSRNQNRENALTRNGSPGDGRQCRLDALAGAADVEQESSLGIQDPKPSIRQLVIDLPLVEDPVKMPGDIAGQMLRVRGIGWKSWQLSQIRFIAEVVLQTKTESHDEVPDVLALGFVGPLQLAHLDGQVATDIDQSSHSLRASHQRS